MFIKLITPFFAICSFWFVTFMFKTVSEHYTISDFYLIPIIATCVFVVFVGACIGESITKRLTKYLLARDMDKHKIRLQILKEKAMRIL